MNDFQNLIVSILEHFECMGLMCEKIIMDLQKIIDVCLLIFFLKIPVIVLFKHLICFIDDQIILQYSDKVNSV